MVSSRMLLKFEDHSRHGEGVVQALCPTALHLGKPLMESLSSFTHSAVPLLLVSTLSWTSLITTSIRTGWRACWDRALQLFSFHAISWLSGLMCWLGWIWETESYVYTSSAGRVLACLQFIARIVWNSALRTLNYIQCWRWSAKKGSTPPALDVYKKPVSQACWAIRRHGLRCSWNFIDRHLRGSRSSTA